MTVLLETQNFLSDKSAPYVILGLGSFIVIYIVVRPFMRRKKDPMEKPNFMRSLSQQRSVERQMENLLVELSEMSRQMTAQLDTRAAKLEMLIKDADERIATLQQISQNAPPSPRMSFAEPKPAALEAPAVPGAVEEDSRHREIYALADSGKSISDIATTLARPSGEIELILALRRT